MKILVDQGLGRSCATILRAGGHDAIHVAELQRHHEADAEIVRFAAGEERAVVTLDADFHAIVATSGLIAPSVIRLRMEGLKSEDAAAIVHRELERFAAVLLEGALITVLPTHTRVHLLPIGEGRKGT